MICLRHIPIVAATLVFAASYGYAPRLLSAQQPPVVESDGGWDAPTAERFYHESQGSVILPAAFLRALRGPDGKHLLDPARMHSYGFLPGAAGKDPYPLGVTADDGSKSGGIPMAGVTCAGCHTAQLQYRGTTLRIDGGGANISLQAFFNAVRTDLTQTAANPAERKRFLTEAIALGYPKAKASQGLDYEVARNAFVVRAATDVKGSNTPGGPGVVDALTGIAFNAFTLGLHDAGNAKRAIAPTNYPYLWDIWHFDWVQYNASVRQPMDRNVGEDVGLGARLNIVDPVTGKLNPEPARWKSTVDIKGLYWIETALEKLKPPTWPGAFGAIDPAKAARGRALFAANCQMCHGISKIAGTTPEEWHVRVVPLTRIGTDPNQAVGFAKATYDATKLGMGTALPGPEGLKYVVEHIKNQAYVDAGIPKSLWPVYDGHGRKGISVAPCGYKARPLVGVWATPPFFHNGSVPSLFDMLSETRPAHPILGNPEFDPVRVGLVQEPAPGTVTMDTALPGNSNAGHWFTNDTARKGRVGRAFADAEKYDLIEYLKSATYADYPATAIATTAIPPMPCVDNPNWAKNLPY